MSFKDENGRWSFDARKVWEIVFSYKMSRGHDSEYGAHQGYVQVDLTMHVLAKDEQMARLAWWERYHHDGENHIKSITCICQIDAEMEMHQR